MNPSQEREKTIGRLLLARLSGTIAPEENEILDNWIKENHAEREFFEYAALNSRLCCMASGAKNEEEVSLKTLHRASKRRRAMLTAAAASLSIAAALALTVVHRTLMPAEEPVTRIANEESSPVRIDLPDGTEVWLQPGAELSYGETFNDSERDVRFSGDAYFNVAHNSGIPFNVITPAFRIRVFGTLFNVNTETDLPEVILAQGSVALQDADGNNMLHLNPGQKAAWNAREGFFDVTETYVGDILLVDYGVISLEDVTVDEIAGTIERHFGVTLQYRGNATVSKHHYDFNFQKDASAQSVVDLLNFICHERIYSISEE